MIWSPDAFSGIFFDVGLCRLLSKSASDLQDVLRARTKYVSLAKE